MERYETYHQFNMEKSLDEGIGLLVTELTYELVQSKAF
jgi:hypothetical protein